MLATRPANDDCKGRGQIAHAEWNEVVRIVPEVADRIAESLTSGGRVVPVAPGAPPVDTPKTKPPSVFVIVAVREEPI